MKVGDLVINLNSESRMTGVVIGWEKMLTTNAPIVQWADGRCGWIVYERARVIRELHP